VVKVPGKLILLGEYAVLEGADAIVAAIDRYTIVEISVAKNEICQLSGNLTSDSIRFLIEEDGKIILNQDQSDQLISSMQFALAIIEKINQKIVEFGFSIKPFNLRIDTSQFYVGMNKNKLGLGSSAALTVAIIVSVSNLMGVDKNIFQDEYDLFDFACDTHFSAQGNRGSGIDIAASVFGGINVYNIKLNETKDRNRMISPISVLEDLFILPIWSGVSVSTRELLFQVENFRDGDEKGYKETMSQLSTLSSSGCVTYSEKQQADFLDIVRDYYQVLKNFSTRSKIPIISDIHERIAGIVYNSGGVYKPSGAGGGDIGIAFCNSKKTLENIKKELNQNEIETLSLGISEQGVEVES
jgi:ERG8-type phosphomevalonate kinase